MELVASLAIALVFAVIVYLDANSYREKGGESVMSPGMWGITTFLLCIVAFPLYIFHVLTRPRLEAGKPSRVVVVQQPAQEDVARTECPQCGELIPARALVCRYCGLKNPFAFPTLEPGLQPEAEPKEPPRAEPTEQPQPGPPLPDYIRKTRDAWGGRKPDKKGR